MKIVGQSLTNNSMKPLHLSYKTAVLLLVAFVIGILLVAVYASSSRSKFSPARAYAVTQLIVNEGPVIPIDDEGIYVYETYDDVYVNTSQDDAVYETYDELVAEDEGFQQILEETANSCNEETGVGCGKNDEDSNKEDKENKTGSYTSAAECSVKDAKTGTDVQCLNRGASCELGSASCDGTAGPLSCINNVCAYCQADQAQVSQSILGGDGIPGSVPCGPVGSDGEIITYASEASYILAWQMGAIGSTSSQNYIDYNNIFNVNSESLTGDTILSSTFYELQRDFQSAYSQTGQYANAFEELSGARVSILESLQPKPPSFTGPYADPYGPLSQQTGVIRWLHVRDGNSAFVVSRNGQVAFQTTGAFLMDVVPVLPCNKSGKCTAIQITLASDGRLQDVLVGETIEYRDGYCTVPAEIVFGAGINAEQALHNMSVNGCGGAPTVSEEPAPLVGTPIVDSNTGSGSTTQSEVAPSNISYTSGSTSSTTQYPSRTTSPTTTTSTTSPTSTPKTWEDWKAYYSEFYKDSQQVKGMTVAEANDLVIAYTKLNSFDTKSDWDWSCKIGDFNADCRLNILDLYLFTHKICRADTIGACYTQTDLDSFIKIYLGI